MVSDSPWEVSKLKSSHSEGVQEVVYVIVSCKRTKNLKRHLMESNSPSTSPCLKDIGKPPDVGNIVEPNHLRASQVAAPSTPRTEGEMIAAMEIELPLKKKAGLIRLLGAPVLDLSEAQRQVDEEQELDEKGPPSPKESGKEDAIISNPPSATAEVSHINTHDSEYLDAANEETFTLETFESLIRNARRAGKAFLLARVTTVDPKNLSRLYYSYYSAYQINKVIFRTQPEEGLLHRMRSKNPLNNMSIVGDVHYFAISNQEFDRAWKLQDALKEQRSVLRSSASITENGGGNSPSLNLTRNSSTHITRGNQDLRRNIFRNHSFSHRKRPQEGEVLTIDPDAALNAGESGIYSVPEMSQVDSLIDLSHLDETVDDAMSVIYEAQYFASDDDFLMRSDVREFFKMNSVAPDDYLLFQLNRPTGTPYEMMILGPDGQPLFRGSHPVPAPRPRPGARHLWGILDDGDHASMVGGLHCGAFSPLGFWLLVIIGSAVGVFCGLVYIPAPNNFLMFGGILCLYILMMLFFVNWGSDGVSSVAGRNPNGLSAAAHGPSPRQPNLQAPEGVQGNGEQHGLAAAV